MDDLSNVILGRCTNGTCVNRANNKCCFYQSNRVKFECRRCRHCYCEAGCHELLWIFHNDVWLPCRAIEGTAIVATAGRETARLPGTESTSAILARYARNATPAASASSRPVHAPDSATTLMASSEESDGEQSVKRLFGSPVKRPRESDSDDEDESQE